MNNLQPLTELQAAQLSAILETTHPNARVFQEKNEFTVVHFHTGDEGLPGIPELDLGDLVKFIEDNQAVLLADLAADIRSQRNKLLRDTDWSQLPDVPDELKAGYQAYRQALRDLPQQEGFPAVITWPTAPGV